MKLKYLGLALLAVIFLLVGCGGSSTLGTNSNVVIKLRRTDGTQDMTGYEVYVTKNTNNVLDTGSSENFVSTTSKPSWSDNWAGSRSTTELDLAFTTRSDQPLYYIFVKVPNTGAAFETLSLEIDTDSNVGPQKNFNLPINATTWLSGVSITRNSAAY